MIARVKYTRRSTAAAPAPLPRPAPRPLIPCRHRQQREAAGAAGCHQPTAGTRAHAPAAGHEGVPGGGAVGWRWGGACVCVRARVRARVCVCAPKADEWVARGLRTGDGGGAAPCRTVCGHVAVCANRRGRSTRAFVASRPSVDGACVSLRLPMQYWCFRMLDKGRPQPRWHMSCASTDTSLNPRLPRLVSHALHALYPAGARRSAVQRLRLEARALAPFPMPPPQAQPQRRPPPPPPWQRLARSRCQDRRPWRRFSAWPPRGRWGRRGRVRAASAWRAWPSLGLRMTRTQQVSAPNGEACRGPWTHNALQPYS